MGSRTLDVGPVGERDTARAMPQDNVEVIDAIAAAVQVASDVEVLPD
jgi:hypothetical protein